MALLFVSVKTQPVEIEKIKKRLRPLESAIGAGTAGMKK